METAQRIETQYYQEQRDVLAASEIFNRAEIEIEAWQLIRQRDVLPKVEVPPQERQDNARTALMEALTASGHLSRIEISGTVEEINAQVTSRLVNGWDEKLPAHEKQRRFAELCEELTIQKVHLGIVAGELPPTTAVGVISDFPESLDSTIATSIGYRVSNKKGMVRSTHLQENTDGTYTRVIEQVSRSNGTWNSTYGFLSAQGIETDVGDPDIVALQTPLIYNSESLADGVVDIVRRLDEHSGSSVRYGDVSERKNHAEYETLREESARREQEIEGYIDDLARLEEQLDHLQSKGMTFAERNTVYKGEVDRILTAICTLEPDYAEDTFGKAVAGHFYEASELVATGQLARAQQLLESANHLKETVTFCGVSISVEKARQMGLEVNSYGDLIEKGKETWKWKTGVCRVESCVTRPGKTEVGPCSVCKKCQAKFDKGDDPTKTKVPAKKSKATYPKVLKKRKIET